MINYRHRWLYAVFIFLVSFWIGKYYFLSPIKNEINLLTEKKFQLEQVLELPSIKQANHVPKKRNDLSWPAQWLSDVLMLSQHNNLQMNYSVKREGEKMIIQSQISGQYQKLNFFLQELSQLSYPMLQKKFILTAIDNQDVKLQLNLEVLPYQIIPKRESFISKIKIKNPFCFSPSFKEIEADIMKVSINDIKLVGVLQNAGESRALLSLPNGLLVARALKEIIGREKAEITKITSTSLTLSSIKNHTFILRIKTP